MTEQMKEKREKLRSMSLEAKILMDTGKVSTINEGLKILYTIEGHDKLKTFKQWKEEGFNVKKGEKALLLWAKPLHILKEQPEPEGAFFFPVINVFSSVQVERGQKC